MLAPVGLRGHHQLRNQNAELGSAEAGHHGQMQLLQATSRSGHKLNSIMLDFHSQGSLYKKCVFL